MAVTTPGVFGPAAAVALRYPLVGLGMCCGCLIVFWSRKRRERVGPAQRTAWSVYPDLAPGGPSIRLKSCGRSSPCSDLTRSA